MKPNEFWNAAAFLGLVLFGWNPIYWLLLLVYAAVWALNKFDGLGQG